MGSPDADSANQSRRVAVVLVAGVGDEGPGETSDAVARRLLEGSTHWTTADRHQVVVRDSESTTHTAHWARLNPSPEAPDAPVVDLFEMHWADLSRFPSGLLRFLSTLYALTIQIATVGQQALRPFRGSGLSGRSARTADRLLTLTAYALAFPVLMVTMVTAIIAAGLTIAVTMNGGRSGTVIPVLAVVAGLFATAAVSTSKLRRGGWHSSARQVAFGIAGLASVLVITCVLVWPDGRVSLANALVFTLAYAFRPVWLILLVLAGAAVASLLLFRSHGQGRSAEHRAAHTALLSVMSGPLIFAIASTALVVSVAVVAQRTVADRTWGTQAAEVRCLRDANDWSVPRSCSGVSEELARTPAQVAIATLVREIDEQESHRRDLLRADASEGGTATLAQRIEIRTSIAQARARIRSIRDEARVGDGAYAQFPLDWALRLFGYALRPLLWALAVLLVLALFAFGTATGYLANMIRPASRWIARRAHRLRRYFARHPPDAERREVVGQAIMGGLLFNWIPRGLGGRAASAFAAAAIWATLLAAILSWVINPDWIGGPGGVPTLGRAAAFLTTSVLVGVRLLGINPLGGSGGGARGALERLRTGLDVAFDITNYLRPARDGREAPRDRMIRRYRAVLGHALADHPDGLVVLCHSQGTILTIACLFGDANREPAVAPIDGGAIAGGFPPRVSLMTFGSPLRQVYDERFPRQFDWLQDPNLAPARLAPLTRHWWNIYRSGDYIGRALWAPQEEPATYDADRQSMARSVGPISIADQCIGSGGHSGYWKDEVWSRFATALILDAAGQAQHIAPGGRPQRA